MLKIVAISDLHGNLPIIDKPAEIMLIAGDVIHIIKPEYNFKSK